MAPVPPTDIELTCADAVETDALLRYYREIYPERAGQLVHNWPWKYRANYFDRQIPLLLKRKNRVIAQAGMIPVDVKVGDKDYQASWFIDFAVSKDYQRQGLGTILTRKWMSFADLQITFCNDQSIGVFRKLGWSESRDSFLHINILSPADLPQVPDFVPRVVRRASGTLGRPLLRWWYRRTGLPSSSWETAPATGTPMQEFLAEHRAAEAALHNPNRLTIQRDEAFVRWRVLESPENPRYFLFTAGGIRALIAPKTTPGKFMDVLWISDLRDPQRVVRLISSLSLYGIEKGFAYLRLHTSSPELSTRLRAAHRSLVRRPLFAWYSEHPTLAQRLPQLRADWQLIDSDFERFLPTDSATNPL